MSNPLKNPPKDGWTKDDRTRRCITDNCGYGRGNDGSWIGMPLSTTLVSVIQRDAPNLVVARACLCIRCGRLYGLTLRLDPETHARVADTMGISRSGIEACLRASKSAGLFNLDDLQNGRMAEVELSDRVKELMAMRSHGAGLRDAQELRTGSYNPDLYIEPKQEELPL